MPDMPWFSALRPLLAAAVAALLLACGNDAGRDAPSDTATDRATQTPATVKAPGSTSSQAATEARPAPAEPFSGEAAPPARANGVVLRVLAEGEVSERGELTLPAMEQDMVYLMARVETEAGQGIEGARISVRSERGNRIMLDDSETDDYGYAAFTIYAAERGVDQLTLAARGIETRFKLDVMALEDSPWLRGLQGEGITTWALLSDVDIDFADEAVRARFGDGLAALDGERVRLAGYMLPMTPEQKQQRFLLSASPPDCFFHMPGGPTTVAMVETADAGVGMTMDPLVVEGRLRLLRESPEGMVYRLEDARGERID